MREIVYVLLPVHNRIKTTSKFVECLRKQTWQWYHLILIDDGSTDGTSEWVHQNISNISIIKGKGDWWWAGSLQQGYNWLKAHQINLHDIVLIINDDTEFEPEFLSTALSILNQKENGNVLLLAQCYSLQTKKLIDAGVCVDWKKLSFSQAKTINEINCLSTRGLFMRVSDFMDIGDFFPRLLPHYTSDYEFTIRAHRKGKRLLTNEALKLWVDQSTTGIRDFDQFTFFEYLKQMFSLRAVNNPVIFSIFIALACPWPWKLVNWFRVWLYAFKGLYGSYRKSLKESL